jgi:hypothetical protein
MHGLIAKSIDAELTNLSSALTHKADDHHVGYTVTGQHSEHHAFAHAGACKNPHPLAPAYRKRTVDCTDPRIQRLMNRRSV